MRSGQFKSVQANAPSPQEVKTAPLAEAKRLPSIASSSQSGAAKPIELNRTSLLASAPPDKSPISQIVQWMQAVTIHNTKVRARLADLRAQQNETKKANNVALETRAKLETKQIQTRTIIKAADEKVQRSLAVIQTEEMQIRALEVQLISEKRSDGQSPMPRAASRWLPIGF